MEECDHMSIEAAGDALRALADELDATHGPQFTSYFFNEHWDAIERVIDRLVNGG